jgi:hypothetical protein
VVNVSSALGLVVHNWGGKKLVKSSKAVSIRKFGRRIVVPLISVEVYNHDIFFPV